MAIVYLGLGSNQGDREQNIKRAIELLEANNHKILQSSTIIETDPVGGPPQGRFLNAVVKIETTVSPIELLRQCQCIERQLGRMRTVPNGPRTIDLDILTFDHKLISLPGLKIPHPRMLEREFVMIPLREITPSIGEVLADASH